MKYDRSGLSASQLLYRPMVRQASSHFWFLAKKNAMIANYSHCGVFTKKQTPSSKVYFYHRFIEV